MDLIAGGVVAHSGTYNGNPVSLAAAEAALNVLDQPGVYGHLHHLGMLLAAGARDRLAAYGLNALVHQVGPVMQILFTDRSAVTDYRAFASCDAARSTLLARELRRRGVLILPDGRWYISVVHTDDDVHAVLAALDASLSVLARTAS
jgi:glutamate-1-semialdehyde 2,1-aminomutase